VLQSVRAGNRIRTGDLLITSQLLYQLSYAGEFLSSLEISGDSLDPQPHFSLLNQESQPFIRHGRRYLDDFVIRNSIFPERIFGQNRI
jgi:hypothetical protein